MVLADTKKVRGRARKPKTPALAGIAAEEETAVTDPPEVSDKTEKVMQWIFVHLIAFIPAAFIVGSTIMLGQRLLFQKYSYEILLDIVLWADPLYILVKQYRLGFSRPILIIVLATMSTVYSILGLTISFGVGGPTHITEFQQFYFVFISSFLAFIGLEIFNYTHRKKDSAVSKKTE